MLSFPVVFVIHMFCFVHQVQYTNLLIKESVDLYPAINRPETCSGQISVS